MKSLDKKSLLTKTAFYFLVSVILFANAVCNKESQNVKTDTADTTGTSSIKFKKQGEVYFQDSTKTMKKQIDVEIADTEDKLHLGLMFRENMDENQGMLFIFNKEEPQGFYMKNTLIPLDIIFINSKKRIVKIYKNAKPLDETDLPSYKPILYVVEVNGGYTDRNKVKEGDYIDWRRD